MVEESLTLEQALQRHQKKIGAFWLKAVTGTHRSAPPLASLPRVGERRFSDPMNYAFKTGLTQLYTLLLVRETPQAAYLSILEPLFRLCAVQPLSPAEALKPFFQLKKIVRDVFMDSPPCQSLVPMLPEFDARVDNMVLAGFDCYMVAREQLFKVRLAELKREQGRLRA